MLCIFYIKFDALLYLFCLGDQGGRGQTAGLLSHPVTTRGGEPGEPFITLAGPDAICVRGAFTSVSEQQAAAGWGRKGLKYLLILCVHNSSLEGAMKLKFAPLCSS